MMNLYSPQYEHDACGVGMIAQLDAEASHNIVADALTVLERMEHRGASGADPDSGDGAGILLQIPDRFLRSLPWAQPLPDQGLYGIGMWFLSGSENVADDQSKAIDALCVAAGLIPLGWRDVPRDSSILGKSSAASEPVIRMQLVSATGSRDLEFILYKVRKEIEHTLPVYAASFSSRTLIYKGMLTSTQLRRYYTDLQSPLMESAIALVHSRFSTNVMPRWELAQPFRRIAHNGEINTIRSNRAWMQARESKFVTNDDLASLTPVVTPDMSDSASFDEVAELLSLTGRSLPHAILMMIPEAWERDITMEASRRDFYRFHAGLMEAWDGPASVSFCDGDVVGAVLDRNGLRPARYWVTSDRRVIFSSEVGVLDLPPADVVARGRLQPGRMFLVDLQQGRIVTDEEIKGALTQRAPYGQWLSDGQLSLSGLESRTMLVPEHARLELQQRLFGYTEEELRLILAPMALAGDEPIGSMGSDSPIGVLSARTKPIYDLFAQQFAQVTNPPLDAIREELVTSLRVSIGPQRNLLEETPEHAQALILDSPVIDLEDLAKIRYLEEYPESNGLRTVAIDGLFEVPVPGADPGEALRQGLDRLEQRVLDALDAGASIIMLSDRHTSISQAPIPALLQVAAVHNRLVRQRRRSDVALVIEAGDVREVHHVALLLSFGASAVSPYLALETVDDLARQQRLGATSASDARYHYVKALNKGVLKVMSKMGVSTVQSYIGSQLFEAIGVADEVLSRCFPNLTGRIGGRNFSGIAEEVLDRHRTAYVQDSRLSERGEYQWRRDGEPHLFNPRTVFKLQHATREKRYDVFREYTRLVDDQAKDRVTLRGMLAWEPLGPPLTVEEVEDRSSILKRFSTGAMSYGSISQEVHETLAIAMNRLGGKSNTGEGGEDADRDIPDGPDRNRRSAIKQVASGRFGVTSRYLVNADDLQIKIAQGAKPGEGGQLPGTKVYPWIAKTRHSTPGVGLISPPPHHDIYSIEDLAQLIYDLKNANNTARVHVKLVAEAGVGTVAAGVAKAKADVILISGHDGGTGAAPLTSLKHAGAPWELGLAETQQTLAKNRLRDRVVVQVDGQLKTGRDVVIAALLGAEEFGFATAPLVVSGCVMMRVCHLDTCPVGIATQNPVLRERFTGRPEFVETFFEFLADEIREYLAAMGARSLDDIIGRTDLLHAENVPMPYSGELDLSRLLAPIEPEQRRMRQPQDDILSQALDHGFLTEAVAAAQRGDDFRYEGVISNVHRTVGTLTGSALTREGLVPSLREDQISLHFRGSAGQSLGAFLPSGLTIVVTGDANDYVGKGLSGGRVVVRPALPDVVNGPGQIVAGNVIGYGATSGQIFLSGVVGERLGVRNSGCTIVAEGAGDHACEYMTGGEVLLLGATGRNMAAGMSGGVLYLYDPDDLVWDRLAAGSFHVDVLDAVDESRVRDLLRTFGDATHSARAAWLQAHWSSARMSFVAIRSDEFVRAMGGQHG
jgi:glutamate synthase (NADPH) large chain